MAAATLTYNPGVGPAVWDTTTANWLNGTTVAIWPNAATSAAIFGGASGASVTLQSGGVTAKDLTFQTNGYTLSGGNLALQGAATSTITLGTGVSTSLGVVLTGGFTKAGAGTLILAGANTFTNGLTVTAGAVSISADGNLGASTSTLTLNGGTLQTTTSFALNSTRTFVLGTNGGSLTASATFTDSGVISGAGSLTLAGTGTVVLGGANTFAGGLNLNSGTLQISSDANLGSTAGVTTINNGAILATTSTFSTNASRTFALGSGVATLDVANGTTLTLQGVVSGSGGIVKNDTGTLTLSGANTYTGGTTMNGGTLSISGDGNLGGTSGGLTLNNAVLLTAANITLASGRTLTLGAGSSENVTSNTLAVTGKVTGSGGLNKNGTGTLTLSSTSNDFSGGVNVNAGTVSAGADSNLGNASNAINLSGGGTLATLASFTLGTSRVVTLGSGGGVFSPGSGFTLTIGTAIGGTSLGKSGSGTLVLGGTNTYTGGTTVTAGTLSISADANLGATSGTLILNGGSLVPTATMALDAARGISIGASGGTISPGTGFTLTIGGVLSGTGPLTKSGTGTLTLTGADTYSGMATVSAGTLNLQAANALSGSLINAGGTINVSSPLATLTSFSNNSGTTNLIAGGSTFGGTISVNGGAVVLQATSGTPAGVGSINLNAGTLLFAPLGSGTTAGVTTATGSGTKVTYGSGSVLAVDKGSYTGSVTLTLGPTNAAADASLVRGGAGALVIAPVDATAGSATADLGVSEKIIVNGGLTNTNGIVAPSIVVQNNNAQKSADFVHDNGGTTGLLSAVSSYTNSMGAATVVTGTSAVENVTYAGASALAASGQVYALRVGNGGTGVYTNLNIGSGNTLTVGTGSGQAGVLLNGTTGTGAGAAQITNGTLAFGGAEADVYVGVPGGTITSAITGTGGLTVFGAGTLTLGSAGGLTGAINVNTGATLLLSAANTLLTGSTVNLAAGGLNLNSQPENFSALTGTGVVNLGTLTTGVLTINNTAGDTYGGAISGAGSLVKQGGGTLVLGGASTFTGGTTISAGMIQLSAGANRLLSTGNLAVASGASLDLNGQSQGVNTLTGPGTVTSSTGNPTLTVSNSGSSFTQDTLLTGALNYVKTGASTVIVPTANTYTGTSSITAGTLQIANTSALPSTSVLTVGTVSATAATLDLSGYNITVGGLTSSVTSGRISNSGTAAATLTVNNNATTDYTFAGNIVDGVSTTALTKTGVRNLTLTGADTYTGGTLISGGTLTGTTGSLQGAITNNAALVFDQTTTGTYAGITTGSGTLTKLSAGTVVLTGANTYAGGTTITGGVLQGNTTSLQGAIANNASLVFDQTTTGNYAGVLSGNGTFTKQNTGIVALSGNNTFSGAFVAAGGTLQVGSSTAIPAASKLIIGATTGGNADAAFDLNGNGVTVTSLSTGTSTGARVVLNNGASPAVLTVNSTAASTFAGTLQDGASTLALAKSGSKTLTLTGANTFTGATVVNGGTLQASGANALQNTASITVNSGGTLEAAAAGAISSVGTITVSNGGSLLLSGTTTNHAINSAAPITLAGGTVTRGAGVSEGAGGSSVGNGGAASSAGFGTLTLTAAGSKLDFSTGASGTLVFSDFSSAGLTLTVDNWNGTARTEGVEGAQDRLLFAQALSATDLANIDFTGFANGGLQISLAGGFFEVVPVPEPATWLVGILLFGVAGRNLRRLRALRTAD